MDAFAERIRQYPGPVQVQRRVKVKVPGKHFPGLASSEQKEMYDGTAVESAERHQFAVHHKAWGGAHRGPGIRFICDSDAVDDPDHKGFWTTLSLWNRWRHETYKDDRQAELQYLDELPLAVVPATAEVNKEKAPPEIKTWFDVARTGTHTVGGTGKLAGTVVPAVWYGCRTPGCPRGVTNPIKCTGADTGVLFAHLERCNSGLAQRLRVNSSHSPLQMGADGETYREFSFDEALPHHARFVEKCFRGFDHFYETRADNGLLEFVQGFDRRATLPHNETCHKLLEVRHHPLQTLERPRAVLSRPPCAPPRRCSRSSWTRRFRS